MVELAIENKFTLYGFFLFTLVVNCFIIWCAIPTNKCWLKEFIKSLNKKFIISLVIVIYDRNEHEVQPN